MKFLYTFLALFWLFVAPPTSAQSHDADPPLIAMAIGNIARRDLIADIRSLSRELKLPDLAQQITWGGPSNASERPQFSAVYRPASSELGIRFVAIRWHVARPFELPVKDNKMQFLNLLRIELDQASCPTPEALEAAIGSKPNKIDHLGRHGGPTYTTTNFRVLQQNERPVSISYGTDTCRIEVSRYRDY